MSYVLQRAQSGTSKSRDDRLPEKPKPSKEVRAIRTLKRKGLRGGWVSTSGRAALVIVQSNDYYAYGSRLACSFTSIYRKDENGKPTGKVRELRDTQVLVAFGEPSFISCAEITRLASELGDFLGTVSEALPQGDVVLKLASA